MSTETIVDRKVWWPRRTFSALVQWRCKTKNWYV